MRTLSNTCRCHFFFMCDEPPLWPAYTRILLLSAARPCSYCYARATPPPHPPNAGLQSIHIELHNSSGRNWRWELSIAPLLSISVTCMIMVGFLFTSGDLSRRDNPRFAEIKSPLHDCPLSRQRLITLGMNLLLSWYPLQGPVSDPSFLFRRIYWSESVCARCARSIVYLI